MINKISLILNSFLASAEGSWIDKPETQDALYIIKNTMVWSLGAVAAFGIIYMIVLGVNYAKSDSGDSKAKAQRKIVNVMIGIVCVIVAIILLYVYIDNMGAIHSWVREIVRAIFQQTPAE